MFYLQDMFRKNSRQIDGHREFIQRNYFHLYIKRENCCSLNGTHNIIMTSTLKKGQTGWWKKNGKYIIYIALQQKKREKGTPLELEMKKQTEREKDWRLT